MGEAPYRILSLDGGGSLGMYTLGVLAEVEKILTKPLHETFDLIYGTSTGSIVGTMVALGDGLDTITRRGLESTEPDARYRRIAQAPTEARTSLGWLTLAGGRSIGRSRGLSRVDADPRPAKVLPAAPW